jgi:hypothetical protein
MAFLCAACPVLAASVMLQEIAGELACVSTEACAVQQLLQQAADQKPVQTLPSGLWMTGGLGPRCTLWVMCVGYHSKLLRVHTLTVALGLE